MEFLQKIRFDRSLGVCYIMFIKLMEDSTLGSPSFFMAKIFN